MKRSEEERQALLRLINEAAENLDVERLTMLYLIAAKL